MKVFITYPHELDAQVRAFHSTVAKDGEQVQPFFDTQSEYTFGTSRLDDAGVAAYLAEFGDTVTVEVE